MDTRLPQSESQSDPLYSYFNFMGLPKELRDSVYGFALARPDPISLPVHHQSLQNDPDPSALPGSVSHTPASTESGTSSPGNLTKNSCDKTVARNNLSPAILRVSKTVYNEARPILYGSNTFTISAKDTFQAVRLLSASRNFVRHLRCEFSDVGDFLKRYPPLARTGLRYFRELKDLVLIFPEYHSDKDREILSGNPYPSFRKWATVHVADWLPINTKVTFVGADFSQIIDWGCPQSEKDQKVIAAIENAIQH